MYVPQGLTGRLCTQAVLACGLVAAPPALAAEFTFTPNDGGGVGFEQRWNQPDNWTLVSGVDDGANGYPDGTDTFTIDRAAHGRVDWGDLDLSNEGLPDHTVAGITATGAPGRDIILKFTGVLTMGDLAVLPSPESFEIQLERDTDFFINGVISGAGDLVISRSGGFSTVEPGEEIVIGGSSPNTMTGTMTLFNANLDNPAEPAFFVADKVGAFGEASLLTVEGRVGGTTTSLQLTANTLGGEGAIDDDATSVVLGPNGVFDVDAGVNEDIGFGLLTVDSLGVIAPGTYDSTESWIIGDGTVTVLPEPSSLALLGLGGLLVGRRRR